MYQQVFDQLITEFHKDLTENGKAFYISSLLERFKSLLSDDVSSENYRSSKLQRRLQNHYKDEIIIQSQSGQGKSNIIINSKITAGDGVRVAQQFIKVVPNNSNTIKNGYSIFTDDDSDHDRVLYHAVSILRDKLSDLKSSNRYPAPNEIVIQSAYGQLPPKLLKIILWLIDSDAYASKESDCNPTDDMKRKSTSTAECISFAGKNVQTTQHAGLAIKLHNDSGSQGRIDDTLYAYGFCISYDKLRRLLTNAAEEEIKRIHFLQHSFSLSSTV